MKTSNSPNMGHSISSFSDYIKHLPEGRYKIIDGKIVKVK